MSTWIDMRADALQAGDHFANGRRILSVSQYMDGLATIVALTYRVPGHGVRCDEYLGWRELPILPGS